MFYTFLKNILFILPFPWFPNPFSLSWKLALSKIEFKYCYIYLIDFSKIPFCTFIYAPRSIKYYSAIYSCNFKFPVKNAKFTRPFSRFESFDVTSVYVFHRDLVLFVEELFFFFFFFRDKKLFDFTNFFTIQGKLKKCLKFFFSYLKNYGRKYW